MTNRPKEQFNFIAFFIFSYMERRCMFLENCSHLETIRKSEGKVIGERNTTKMRSTLFAIMQEEVGSFCKQSLSWSSDVYRQVC